MWATIGGIFIKYWIEFLLGLVVAGGGFLIRRYAKLERDERQRSQDAHYQALTNKIQEENKIMIESLVKEHDEINKRSDERYNEITSKVQAAMIAGREESKQDDAVLQDAQVRLHEMGQEGNDCLCGHYRSDNRAFRLSFGNSADQGLGCRFDRRHFDCL